MKNTKNNKSPNFDLFGQKERGANFYLLLSLFFLTQALQSINDVLSFKNIAHFLES